jgi:GDP-mannose 4,6-dehydratase
VKVLITGVTGFVGGHLARYIVHHCEDVELWGIKRWRSPTEGISDIESQIRLIDCDLLDLGSIVKAISSSKPDIIFHLAAQSYVPISFTAPVETYNTNVLGTINVLEAVRACGIDPVVHVCSSSEVYGAVPESEIPTAEDCPMAPISPYGVSKAAGDMTAYAYFKAYGMKTVRSRAFSHSGPNRGRVFVDSFFARQIVQIERGLQEPFVRVGGLESVRTFCDVRDIVRGYWLLACHGVAGEAYNIGGTCTLSIRAVLEMVIKFSTYRGQIQPKVDETLQRPTDVLLQIPNCSKFQALTGWTPEIPYYNTLRDIVSFWRDQR